jgi:hypothetical protein
MQTKEQRMKESDTQEVDKQSRSSLGILLNREEMINVFGNLYFDGSITEDVLKMLSILSSDYMDSNGDIRFRCLSLKFYIDDE